MRDEVIDICVEALRARGETVDRETVMSDPRLSGLLLELLRDCRPLPVIRTLIKDVEGRRASDRAVSEADATELPTARRGLDGGASCESRPEAE